MQIRLENIGIVKDAKIALNGLTVITGKNNSGKTTVGKALYSLLDAVCNLQQKAANDRQVYIINQLRTVYETLELLRFVIRRGVRINREAEPSIDFDIFSEYSALCALLSQPFYRSMKALSYGGAESFAHTLANELTAIGSSFVLFPHDLLSAHGYDKEYEDNHKRFEAQRKEALAILVQLFSDLEKDTELTDYARESINQTLQMEFAGQIQPIRAPDSASRIELSSDTSVSFRLSVAENRVVNDGTPVFFGTPYKKVYLVDDPYILDDTSNWDNHRRHEAQEAGAFLNPNRLCAHADKLKFVLRSETERSIFEQTLLNDRLKTVKEKIDGILPGTFAFSADGEYYVHDGQKLKISNLAAGSKMFSIVKMLLEKGELNASTMLILDEPEAHLHPQWQNAFAELLMLLIQELGVTVLLTTHSPNFMLALDANMRKYALADKTNFYQTDVLEDGFVRYQCVNEDMGKIYQDFTRYLSEAKILRNQYLYAEDAL